MKKIIALFLANFIILGAASSTSATELHPVKDDHYNSFHVMLAPIEEFSLMGRNIDIISGNKSAVNLNKHIISFTNPGIYVIKVNGCISDEYYTFIVTN